MDNGKSDFDSQAGANGGSGAPGSGDHNIINESAEKRKINSH